MITNQILQKLPQKEYDFLSISVMQYWDKTSSHLNR